jgi:hypothetical protein
MIVLALWDRIFSRFAWAWTRKLLRLASFPFLGLTLQLFLELLMLHQLIGALPNFCYIGFGRVEVPSQPGGYFHLYQLLSVPNGQSRSCDEQQMFQLRLSSSFLQNEQIVRKGALKLHSSRPDTAVSRLSRMNMTCNPFICRARILLGSPPHRRCCRVLALHPVP